ncbi:CcoQ/FixQ family Cbb3-type cytochrome c oxidase assembly chaperone [Endozoicomonas sp. OPT23]|uniref:cbb3-type cytochrome oxidase subunit 3 n=1 Tax=Endozoicomonas sp. OPT23 TaxID=2072845 RepID=UPI00129A9E80|nr:cbb3-type cytochrome c oxidase subunit 3 [Endozoicomonas sp. OPT23]MRI35410.1 CcoQ/FixQ family Cbb3-type cytochrome c oxidase assembly chaperone [Endozoicomonas sp. OPT23]
MDINDIRGLATLFALIAFVMIGYWAYSGRNKQKFEDAASLPFADDAAHKQSQNSDGTDKNEGVIK